MLVFRVEDKMLYKPSRHTIVADNPRSNRLKRRTALVVRELARYKVNIATLSETRFSEQGQLEEVGAGYNFFWSGRSRTERRDSGVVFAIQGDRVAALLSAAGYQQSPDEPPPAFPERQIRHHRWCLRSPDDQP
ncbi:hypothetical protein SprV_0200837600 [Sparganum proliferum]